jgi:transposase
VPTPGSNRRRSLFGAVNLTTGDFHDLLSRKAVSAVFCHFLGMLLAAYPDPPTAVMICDNGSIHHSGITARRLASHPRLLLIEAARYSPQDNPVERIWASLKTWIANTAPATMADRIRQTPAFFRHRTPDQMLATAAPWNSPRLPDGYGQDFWSAG